MKAVWKDETTHAESVYCMCSIPHTAIECYRHRHSLSLYLCCLVYIVHGLYLPSYKFFCHWVCCTTHTCTNNSIRFNTTFPFAMSPLLLLLPVRTHFSVGFVYLLCTRMQSALRYDSLSHFNVHGFFPLSLSSFSSHYIRECEFHLWSDVLKHTEKKSGNMVFRRNQKHKLFVSMCCSIVVCMCSCFETQSFFTSLSFYVCFVAVTMRSFLWCP